MNLNIFLSTYTLQGLEMHFFLNRRNIMIEYSFIIYSFIREKSELNIATVQEETETMWSWRVGTWAVRISHGKWIFGEKIHEKITREKSEILNKRR